MECLIKAGMKEQTTNKEKIAHFIFEKREDEKNLLWKLAYYLCQVKLLDMFWNLIAEGDKQHDGFYSKLFGHRYDLLDSSFLLEDLWSILRMKKKQQLRD